MTHGTEPRPNYSQNPTFWDGDAVGPEACAEAKETLLRFASIDQDTITEVDGIDTLNALLANGQLARSFDAVIRAQSQGKLFPVLLSQEGMGGEDDERRRTQLTVLDNAIAYSRTRYTRNESGGFIEALITLPAGPLTPEKWGESTAFAQTARSEDENTWAAYYPTVEEGPARAYLHYADDCSSYSAYAQSVQNMARDTLVILPSVVSVVFAS